MIQNVDDSVRDQTFERLREIPENNKCFDCDSKKPKWASVNLGLFLCMDCAGKHREYGANYSFVRSLTLDSWSSKQILFMENGGNKPARDYWKRIGVITEANPKPEYKSPNAQKYKQELERKVEAILREINKKNMPEPAKKEEKAAPLGADKVGAGAGKQTSSPAVEKTPVLVSQENKNEKDFFADSLKNPNNFKVETNNFEFGNKPGANNNKAWGSASNKGKLQGKKINDFDFNDLKLEDSSFGSKSANPGKMDAPVFQNFESKSSSSSASENKPASNPSFASSYSSNTSAENQERLQKLKQENVKAISSQNFFNDHEENMEAKASLNRLGNATAISSAQLFGEESPADQNSNSQMKENFKHFMDNAGAAAKNISGKAGEYFSKLKQGWQK